MKKLYQIFISSTYTDLVEERSAVRDAILNMHQFPIGMEQFNASDAEQWQSIKESIDTSDFYVLIVGKRYGSWITEGEDAGISYTEKEFRYAQRSGVPILAFIKDDSANFAGNAFETDPKKMEKLTAFVETVKTGRTVKWFSNRFQLAEQVVTALHNEIEKDYRPGWVRGDKDAIETKTDELIRLLKGGPVDNTEDDIDDHFDKVVSEYEFTGFQRPTDGQHKKVNENGEPIAEGEWKKEKLITGIEYNWLIHVTQGKLIFKPNCPENPYDSSEDFKYEKFEQYDALYSFIPFHMSEEYIIHDGLSQYYVVDMQVENKMEQMFNIRTLEEFLKKKDPERLESLKELMEMEAEDGE